MVFLLFVIYCLLYAGYCHCLFFLFWLFLPSFLSFCPLFCFLIVCLFLGFGFGFGSCYFSFDFAFCFTFDFLCFVSFVFSWRIACEFALFQCFYCFLFFLTFFVPCIKILVVVFFGTSLAKTVRATWHWFMFFPVWTPKRSGHVCVTPRARLIYFPLLGYLLETKYWQQCVVRTCAGAQQIHS